MSKKSFFLIAIAAPLVFWCFGFEPAAMLTLCFVRAPDFGIITLAVN